MGNVTGIEVKASEHKITLFDILFFPFFTLAVFIWVFITSPLFTTFDYNGYLHSSPAAFTYILNTFLHIPVHVDALTNTIQFN